MTIAKRRFLGIIIAALAAASFPILALAGIPLLHLRTVHIVETGANTSSLQIHWPLWILLLAFAGGLLMALLPRSAVRAVPPVIPLSESADDDGRS